MKFLKTLVKFKDSETVQVVVKIIFFILKQIFRKNCDGSNKKG